DEVDQLECRSIDDGDLVVAHDECTEGSKVDATCLQENKSEAQTGCADCVARKRDQSIWDDDWRTVKPDRQTRSGGFRVPKIHVVLRDEKRRLLRYPYIAV